MNERQYLFDHLWATALGRCFIHNLLDSVELGTLCHATAASVLDECGGALLKKPSLDVLEELPAIVLGLDAYLESPVRPSKLPEYVATSFDARWAIAPLSTHSDHRVRDLAGAILDFYRVSPRRARPELAAKERRVHQLVHLVAGSNPDGLIDLSMTTDLLGAKRFGWFTSYDDGDEEQACWLPATSWPERGDATRDVLGLIHYGSSSVGASGAPGWMPMLIATYVVPRAAIDPAVRYGRPNGFDGLGGTRFKARFGRAREPASEWGRTVNLRRITGGRPHRGGKEMVLENFTPRTSLRLTVAGAVWVPRNDFLGHGDAAFAAIVAGKRAKHTRERKFLYL